MDHAFLLTWALMPEVVGAMRGPLCTSGIEDLRAGAFRRKQAAFRSSIHNDGWGWATGSPYTDLICWSIGRTSSARAAREPGRPDLATAAARVHDRGAAGPQ